MIGLSRIYFNGEPNDWFRLIKDKERLFSIKNRNLCYNCVTHGHGHLDQLIKLNYRIMTNIIRDDEPTMTMKTLAILSM